MTTTAKKANNAYETISLDQIDLLNEPRWSINLKQQKNKSLIDKYVAGAKDRFAITHIIRDTVSDGDKFRNSGKFCFFL
jgi:hypothetical protein